VAALPTLQSQNAESVRIIGVICGKKWARICLPFYLKGRNHHKLPIYEKEIRFTTRTCPP
jgi:hypothetical protein